MSDITAIEMRFIDNLFEPEDKPGYVMDFSNRTVGDFFAQELNIDIDLPHYSQNGTSKLNRLRYFLRISDNETVAHALRSLWEYREIVREAFTRKSIPSNASKKLYSIADRLDGGQPSERPKATASASFYPSDKIINSLKSELMGLSVLDPQPRGYAFEKFLKNLFDAFGMEGREAFRLRGEQIDGSFLMAHETYLLEAKWQNAKTAAADLRAFNGKIEEKASWTRGLFISQSGFSEDGLHAFGRRKSVICMDGLDLYETLDRKLILNEVLLKKVRRAGETGNIFVPVRELCAA